MAVALPRPLSLSWRVEYLLYDLCERYGIPYSAVVEKCRVYVEALSSCLDSLPDPGDCRLEYEALVECLEELVEEPV